MGINLEKMDIEPLRITVRELVKDYYDNEELGVRGYGGRLDIRPPYQREFVYDEKRRAAVIDTVRKGYPLNVMYWAKRDDDAECPYEVMDGQQRTISICQYVNGDFSIRDKGFHNLTDDEKEQILNYELTIYVCSGKNSEKLNWFETINIAGLELRPQELRNAVYAGPFVSDAKIRFSKTNCAAYNMAKDLIDGSPIRQDYLETVLGWKARAESTPDDKLTIKGYMGRHQHDPNAIQLWQYFTSVVTWVKATFKTKNRSKIMKGVDWGALYDEFHDKVLDIEEIEKEVQRLILDDDVQKKSGICPYVLTKDEHYLNLRAFSDGIKQKVYEKQHHRCANLNCPHGDREFELEKMEADHITPWSEGGQTIIENCQMLCRDCNRRKGAK